MISGCARRSTPGFLFLGPKVPGFVLATLVLVPKIELEGETAGFRVIQALGIQRRSGKSRQTRPRDPGAFRWTRNTKFFDNRKAGKSTPITSILITVGRGAMVWIITSSARVEQYCG